MIKQKGIIFAPLSRFECEAQKTKRDHWNNKETKQYVTGKYWKQYFKERKYESRQFLPRAREKNFLESRIIKRKK